MTWQRRTGGLTPEQAEQYDRDGYTVVPSLFTREECDAYIRHFTDVHAGRITIPEVKPFDPADWGRWFNPHLHDPAALEMLIHPKLRGPLEALIDGAVDGIQTMYFWKGSEQPRHQDRYYLPECFSAWCALVDVHPGNGTLYVQPGSHRRGLLTRDSFRNDRGELLPLFGKHYDDAVDAQFARNAQPEVAVEVNAGDVVLFHGALIHRGGPILEPGSFRHVMANHYIPHAYDGAHYEGYPRIAFDGTRRLSVKRSA